jgi:O-antigen ligase/Flp pilus assembly protein TadD
MHTIIKRVVWGALILIPFLALYVADGGTFDVIDWGTLGLYFPFITGKNLLFRVLVEVAFAGWVILALRDTAYRVNIKKSPLLIAYGVFMVVLLLADVFGVDMHKSLWSNFERMEGFAGHIHFFLYFFVLTAMLTKLSDWQKLFKVFLASNALVLVYGYGQMLGAKDYFFAKIAPTAAAWFSSHFPIHMSDSRLDATIGNSAYFAIYCLMSAGIAALLWSQSERPKKERVYPALIALNLVALFYSGTRGTMIGLMVAAFVTLGIIAWKEKGHARKMFVGAIVAMLLVIGSIFALKNTSFIKSSPTLSRIASISPTDVTTMSRLSIWKISFEAFKERPVLGYGQDNFSYIFARKFIPEKMFNLEPWYDRSHDVFFDWLVAAGALGLIAYLSLYVVALSNMWHKNNPMPLKERAILTGLIAGYFVHNIFVFDNLTSYILFFALLAYIGIRTRHTEHTTGGKVYDEEQVNLIFAPIVLILLLVSLYCVAYRPFLVNRLLIRGLSLNQLSSTMPFADAVKVSQEAFQSALALDTLGSDEAREQFLQMGLRMSQVNIPPATPPGDKQAITQAVNNYILAVRDDIAASLPAHKDDVRMLSIYGMFFNGIGDAVSAEQILSHAHDLAPKKQILTFDLIRAYLLQKKYAQAYALARETYDLAPGYGEAAKWYVLSAAYNSTFVEARSHLAENGQTIPLDSDVITALVSTGQTTLAITLLQEAKKLNPSLASQIDAFIKTLVSPKK